MLLEAAAPLHLSVLNPLSHLSDDELVAEHSRQAVNNHFLGEMVRRHKKGSADLGNRIWWLNLWLLVFTVAMFLLTGVLVWTAFREVRSERGQAAGGAWVMWQEIHLSTGSELGVVTGHPTSAECERALTNFASRLRQNGNSFELMEPRLLSSGSSKIMCLPDTIDPRGPKGK